MSDKAGSKGIPKGYMATYGRLPGSEIPDIARRVYTNANLHVATYFTDADALARMLPEPLEPNPALPPFISAVLFCPDDYYGTDGRNAPYKEFAFYLPCKYKEHDGVTIYPLFLDGELSAGPLTHGRELYGYPKEGAAIHVHKRGNRTNGTVIREGLPLVTITTTRKEEIPAETSPLAQVQTVLLVKEIPSCDFTGYDVRKIVGCRFSDILELTGAWNAEGSLTLGGNESESMADSLPIVEPGPCFEFTLRGKDGAGAVNPDAAFVIEDLLG